MQNRLPWLLVASRCVLVASRCVSVCSMLIYASSWSPVPLDAPVLLPAAFRCNACFWTLVPLVPVPSSVPHALCYNRAPCASDLVRLRQWCHRCFFVFVKVLVFLWRSRRHRRHRTYTLASISMFGFYSREVVLWYMLLSRSRLCDVKGH